MQLKKDKGASSSSSSSSFSVIATVDFGEEEVEDESPSESDEVASSVLCRSCVPAAPISSQFFAADTLGSTMKREQVRRI